MHGVFVVPRGSTKHCLNNSREVKRYLDTRGNGQNLLPCSLNGKGKKSRTKLSRAGGLNLFQERRLSWGDGDRRDVFQFLIRV